jgi:hypothetical protein
MGNLRGRYRGNETVFSKRKVGPFMMEVGFAPSWMLVALVLMAGGNQPRDLGSRQVCSKVLMREP